MTSVNGTARPASAASIAGRFFLAASLSVLPLAGMSCGPVPAAGSEQKAKDVVSLGISPVTGEPYSMVCTKEPIETFGEASEVAARFEKTHRLPKGSVRLAGGAEISEIYARRETLPCFLIRPAFTDAAQMAGFYHSTGVEFVRSDTIENGIFFHERLAPTLVVDN